MALQNLDPAEALSGLSGWSHDGTALVREFSFESFAEAISFVNRVAALAEAQDHHPDIDVRYTKVVIRSWTHVTGGVTERDVRLAVSVGA